MADMTNCPNCGAPITGPSCEYCGTRFVNADSKLELLKLKIEALENVCKMQELYRTAIAAMQFYRGL